MLPFLLAFVNVSPNQIEVRVESTEQIKSNQPTENSNEVLNVSYSWIVLVFGISSLIGGIVGFLLFTRIYKKKTKDYIFLSDDNLTSEILNLRSRIQTIYIAGPLAAIILAFLGIQSLDDINKVNEKTVEDYVSIHFDKEIKKRNLEEPLKNLGLSAKALDLIVKNQGVVLKSELGSYIKDDIDLYSKIQKSLLYVNYDNIFDSQLTKKGFAKRVEVFTKMSELTKEKADQNAFETYVKSQDEIQKSLNDRFVSSLHLDGIQELINNKENYVKLTDLNFVANSTYDATQKSNLILMDGLKKENLKLRVQLSLAETNLTNSNYRLDSLIKKIQPNN